MTPQQALYALAHHAQSCSSMAEWWRDSGALYHRGIYGKRTLRRALRQVDAWRRERDTYSPGFDLRVRPHTFWATRNGLSQP